jgi:hypothetical protein
VVFTACVGEAVFGGRLSDVVGELVAPVTLGEILGLFEGDRDGDLDGLLEGDL